jgi:hypothetical protein
MLGTTVKRSARKQATAGNCDFKKFVVVKGPQVAVDLPRVAEKACSDLATLLLEH